MNIKNPSTEIRKGQRCRVHVLWNARSGLCLALGKFFSRPPEIPFDSSSFPWPFHCTSLVSLTRFSGLGFFRYLFYKKENQFFPKYAGLLSEEKLFIVTLKPNNKLRRRVKVQVQTENVTNSIPSTQLRVCWLRGVSIQFPEISYSTVLYHLLNGK